MSRQLSSSSAQCGGPLICNAHGVAGRRQSLSSSHWPTMSPLPSHLAPRFPRPLGLLLGGGALCYALYRAYTVHRLRKLRAEWAAHGDAVVVVHAVPRPFLLPSLTPFAIKLETFLRLVDIPYVMDYKELMGPKGKNPWITLNGVDYSDSQFIAEMLMERFNKHPDADLTKEQKAASLAMRLMLEEHVYWGMVSWRYVEDNCKGLFTLGNFNWFLRTVLRTFKGKAVTWLHGQGMGRHSVEEIHELMRRDLQALTDFLGDKKFLLGEEPHMDDCSVFGFLMMALHGVPDSHFQAFVKGTPTLMAYLQRMKEKFWPDWEQCISHPKAA